MKLTTCFLFVLLTIPAFCYTSESLIQKQKGWYVSANITRTFMMAPLINWRGGNPIIYISHPVTVSSGYRILPKVRSQIGLSYSEVAFNNSIDNSFHGINNFSMDDHGQFLNVDLQIKGLCAKPKIPIAAIFIGRHHSKKLLVSAKSYPV